MLLLTAMRINPHTFPSADNYPTILSKKAIGLWKQQFSSKAVQESIDDLSSEQAWIEACSLVYQDFLLNGGVGDSWGDPSITSNVGANDFIRRLNNVRASVARVINNNGFLYEVKFNRLGTKRSLGIRITGDKLVFSVAWELMVDLANQVKPLFLKISKDYGLIVRGKRSNLKNVLKGSKTGLRINNFNKLEFYLITMLDNFYVPEELMIPIPEQDEFESVMKAIYFKTIRTFTIKNADQRILKL